MSLPRGSFGELIDRHSRFLLDPTHLRIVRTPPHGYRLESRLPCAAAGVYASAGSLLPMIQAMGHQQRASLRWEPGNIALLPLDEDALTHVAQLTTHSFWKHSTFTWPETILIATALQYDLILVSANALRHAEFGVRSILPHALGVPSREHWLPGQTRLVHQRGLAFCGFEAWHLPDQRIAVRFTEYPGNRGRSVTNCIEDLATAATVLLGRDSSQLLVAEHTIRYGSSPSEIHDEVAFAWDGERLYGPEWKRRDESWWQRLREHAQPCRLPPLIAVEDVARLLDLSR